MRILFVCCVLFSFLSSAQSIRIAQSYYDRGQLEKAALSYEELYQKNPGNSQIIIGLAKTYRQLERFEEAVKLLEEGFKNNPARAEYLVEITATYSIAKNTEKAKIYTNQVIDFIQKNPERGGNLGRMFQEYNMLEPAIKSFEIAMENNPSLSYSLEVGRMYGELGNYAGMFDYYLDYMLERPESIMTVKRYLDEFITEDASNEANILFRKTLLKKNQVAPDIFYNELLSWLFVQQKQFKKAFQQEKAIYKKTDEGIPQLMNLAMAAKEHKASEVAQEALEFIINNSPIESYTLNANRELLKLRIANSSQKNYADITKSYQALIETYGKEQKTLNLLLDYAYFLGFKQDRKQEATKFLKPLLKLKYNRFSKARIELLLADILILDNKFNQALIYYSRAKKKVKNHPLSQEASFKIAKASYYKGDFDWAKTQLNVLKASTTQLIANDAMELALIIEDNTQEDSTFTALKKYAKASLYSFQEQPQKAMLLYTEILDEFQGNSIEDDALYQQALLFLDKNDNANALANFEKITQFFPQSLLIDDTYFQLGLLHEKLGDTEKAKQSYEQIIFDHADSIYYVEARKAYRKLRGDDVVN